MKVDITGKSLSPNDIEISINGKKADFLQSLSVELEVGRPPLVRCAFYTGDLNIHLEEAVSPNGETNPPVLQPSISRALFEALEMESSPVLGSGKQLL